MDGLFGSNILEVALGMIFVYFLLSIICSSINEMFAGLLKWRARDLERGLVNLIRDPGIARNLLNNPLVVAMGSRNTEHTLVKLFASNRVGDWDKVYVKNRASQVGKGEMVAKGENKEPPIKNYAGKPSYIPSRTFVLALLGTLVGSKSVNIESVRAAAQSLVDQSDRDPNSPLDPNLEALRKTLLLLLDDSKDSGKLVIGLDEFRRFVQTLPDTSERTQILS